MGDFAVYEAFSPLDYLQSYYGKLDSEADGLLRFLVASMDSLPDNLSLLEFGGGPTLISLIPVARKASYIHFCDYVPENRDLVSRWLAGDESDFDWQPFIRRCLDLEGVNMGTGTAIADRVNQIRDRVKLVTGCDITRSPPVESSRLFDVIVTNYCLDAVTNDKAVWHAHINNVKSMLKPGGLFIMSSLKEATYSDFGQTRYPNVFLVEDDIFPALRQAGFNESSFRVTTADADHDSREYKGVIFASATS